jgi:hypothetical protein
MSDEFYIGYEPEMPVGLASRIRRLAGGIVSLAIVVSVMLLFAQDRFASGAFEFGRLRTFTGRLVEFPYPALVSADGAPASTVYWLVGAGKHGAADIVRGRDGQRVRLSGSLIQREGDVMIEVIPDSLAAISDASPVEPIHSRGVIIAEGEIVDTKCHLGVMKPGEGPTHRDCAVRCLLGRIPPMFVPHGRPDLGRVSLVSEAAQPFADPEVFAGRRVAIRGEILLRGAQTFLAVVRRDIRLLD